MKSNRLSPETRAIIHAIESATGAAQVVATKVSEELATHTRHDDERFEALTVLVTSVANDVKSLLESRSFVRGAWKAIIGISVAVSTIIGMAIAWIRH